MPQGEQVLAQQAQAAPHQREDTLQWSLCPDPRTPGVPPTEPYLAGLPALLLPPPLCLLGAHLEAVHTGSQAAHPAGQHGQYPNET